MMTAPSGQPDYDPDSLVEAMRWALNEKSDPALSAVNWVAADIIPGCESICDLLGDPNTSLDRLEQAKNVFKALRMIGETPEERRLAARLYAATIAAAIVHHDTRISRQSDAALHRALSRLAGDVGCPDPLRPLIRRALRTLTPAPPRIDEARGDDQLR